MRKMDKSTRLRLSIVISLAAITGITGAILVMYLCYFGMILYHQLFK